jgi:hypothetical protein
LRVFKNIINLEFNDNILTKKWSNKFYELLKNQYELKYYQAHIIDEWIKSWDDNVVYKELPKKELVDDYFNLEQDKFIDKYFPNKKRMFKKPISSFRYNQIIANLDNNQKQVIDQN